jgi:Ser-tRNA(Ala) deacylase AlaX
MDITKEWFWQQWYTAEELTKLQAWLDISTEVSVKQNADGKWAGFHTLDTEFEIDIAGQPTEEDCRNWMKRLRLTVIEKQHENNRT